jgi:predicted Zn finger-like uncharacterized protein
MLITCRNCASSFPVDPSRLPPAGARVHCDHCGHIRFVANTGAMAVIPQAHRADITEKWGSPRPPRVRPPRELPEVPAELAPAPEAPPAKQTVAEPEPAEETLANDSDWEIDDAPSAEIPNLRDAVYAMPRAELRTGHDIRVARMPAPERRAIRRVDRIPRSRWRPSSIGTSMLVLIAVNVSLLAWRADVVRALPQTASFYETVGLPVNVRGLSFGNIETMVEVEDGAPMLVVTGTIANVARREVELPRLRFGLRTEQGHEIYAWTAPPPAQSLAPAAALPFRSRLASPPIEGKAVIVRFVNRRDAAAGIE